MTYIPNATGPCYEVFQAWIERETATWCIVTLGWLEQCGGISACLDIPGNNLYTCREVSRQHTWFLHLLYEKCRGEMQLVEIIMWYLEAPAALTFRTFALPLDLLKPKSYIISWPALAYAYNVSFIGQVIMCRNVKLLQFNLGLYIMLSTIVNPIYARLGDFLLGTSQ